MQVANIIRESSKVRYSSRFKLASGVLAVGASLCLSEVSKAGDGVSVAPVSLAVMNVSSDVSDLMQWESSDSRPAVFTAPDQSKPASIVKVSVEVPAASEANSTAPLDISWPGAATENTAMVITGAKSPQQSGTALTNQLQATLTSGASATNAINLPTLYDSAGNQQNDSAVNTQAGQAQTNLSGGGFSSIIRRLGLSRVTNVPSPLAATMVLGGVSFFGLRRRRRA